MLENSICVLTIQPNPNLFLVGVAVSLTFHSLGYDLERGYKAWENLLTLADL